MQNSNETRPCLAGLGLIARLQPYRDTVGKLTIGYGRNLDDCGITQRDAEQMLREDVEDARTALLTALPWFRRLDPVRRAVLVDMAFNLGPAGLLKFGRTLSAVEQGDYETAAVEMLDSKWAGQVGQRATRLAEMMRTGEWPAADVDRSGA